MSSRILSSQEGYVAGWLDSSVHDFHRSCLSPRASTKYARITWLDSNPKPAALLAIAEPYQELEVQVA